MISYNINDLTIVRALDLYGEFSEIEVAFLCEFLEDGDVTFEVGANIGSLTVPLANAVGEEGTLIAFEPQPVLFQNLCANIALNGLRHIRRSTPPSAIGKDPSACRSWTIPNRDSSARMGSALGKTAIQSLSCNSMTR